MLEERGRVCLACKNYDVDVQSDTIARDGW